MPDYADRYARDLEPAAAHQAELARKFRLREGDQPLPTPNDSPSIQSLVRADLDQREQVGIHRYGTPLQPFNGRDALRDAYEEALDLATYLRQVIAERDTAVVDDPPLPDWERELLEREAASKESDALANLELAAGEAEGGGTE